MDNGGLISYIMMNLYRRISPCCDGDIMDGTDHVLQHIQSDDLKMNADWIELDSTKNKDREDTE